MSQQDVLAWIRHAVREQHATNGGEIHRDGIALEAAYRLAEDAEAQSQANLVWAKEATRKAAAAIRGGESVRTLLIAKGGISMPIAQMTLFDIGEFAAKQLKTSQTMAALARTVQRFVEEAIAAGADPSQRPEDVLTDEQLEAVYRLTRQADTA